MTNNFDTLADRIREEATQATRPGQLQRLEALADEVDRLRQGGRTLGTTLDFWLTLAKDVTGSSDVIAADGDGDWGLVAERLAAMKPDQPTEETA